MGVTMRSQVTTNTHASGMSIYHWGGAYPLFSMQHIDEIVSHYETLFPQLFAQEERFCILTIASHV